MNITRTDFLKKLIRFLMISILAIIAIALGNRVVMGANCSVCPGNGICKGETDCDNYN